MASEAFHVADWSAQDVEQYLELNAQAEAVEVEAVEAEALQAAVIMRPDVDEGVTRYRGWNAHKKCLLCQQEGHYMKTCPKTNSVPPQVQSRNCSICLRPGHYAKTCKDAPKQADAFVEGLLVHKPKQAQCAPARSASSQNCALCAADGPLTCCRMPIQWTTRHVYKSLCLTCCVENGVQFKV